MIKTVKVYYLSIFVILCGLIVPFRGVAQVGYSIETTGILSTSDTTPFWIQSNKSGLYSNQGSQFLTRIQSFGGTQLTDNIRMDLGGELIARPGTHSTLSLNQAYAHLSGYGIKLSAGRFESTSAYYPHDLGVGFLGISRNATPIPMVRVGLESWTAIPFTFGYIQILGHLTHGWLGSQRATDNVLLHEKAGYARFGGKLPLNFFGGVEHQVVWGGDNNPRFGKLPSSLNDYPRVFFALGGDDTAPPGEQDYMLGDHLGSWNFGFFLNLESINITGYRQFPLETKNNLKFKSPQDALTGIHATFDEDSSPFLKEVVYEFLYTKWQNGPQEENTDPDRRDDFQGNENYYNHTIYETGWVYNRRTLGNPLFLPRNNNLGVANNRIVAHHFALKAIAGDHAIKAKATYSKNSGTWIQPYDPIRTQWSVMAGIESPFTFQDIKFKGLLEAALDSGSLVGNQFGVLMGIRWISNH